MPADCSDLEASADVVALVTAAAEQLVDDIEAARRWTNHWTHDALGEALIDVAMSKCMTRLAATQCWGKANEAPSRELWRVAGSHLETGLLQHRARFKPRGYAGDYQMQAWIFDEHCCEHPLGRHFDRYFLKQAAPRAVQARMLQSAQSLVAHFLVSRRSVYHVVSVGSGPGIDIEQALDMLSPEQRRSFRVTLLDLDEEGLDHARARLLRLIAPEQLVCIRENLFRLPKKKRVADRLRDADFLVCTGFFDYLPDQPASEMLHCFWNSLSTGGMLAFGNFAWHCPTRALMEWIGNWYLLFRTPADVIRLAELAGLPIQHCQVGAEHLGVDLFLSAVKPPVSRIVPPPHFSVTSRRAARRVDAK